MLAVDGNNKQIIEDVKISNQRDLSEINELLRSLQKETLNEDWGYWHISELDLLKGDSVRERVVNTLSKIEKYTNPYQIIKGESFYNSELDLKNLLMSPISNLKNEIVRLSDYWANFQGPTTSKEKNSMKFDKQKYVVADRICEFFNKKKVLSVNLVSGIDTFYSFGRDHMGDDILIETESKNYVIHFGFSS